MLDKLLKCETMSDFVDCGTELLQNHAYSQLQKDIAKGHLMLNSTALWERDTLNLRNIQTLVADAKTEDLPERTLHMLQLLQVCCPAINASIDRLIKRASY